MWCQCPAASQRGAGPKEHGQGDTEQGAAETGGQTARSCSWQQGWETGDGRERGPTPQLAGSCQGQDLERRPAGGISWRSCMPGQLFIEQKGLKNTTSLVLEGIKLFCFKTAASPL